MEQCLGDQQLVTLLLYLDDICIFAPTIDEMLDCIRPVFDRHKKFNLKIKSKKCQFFSTSVLFLGHVLLAKDILANPEKVRPGLFQKHQGGAILSGVSILLQAFYSTLC